MTRCRHVDIHIEVDVGELHCRRRYLRRLGEPSKGAAPEPAPRDGTKGLTPIPAVEVPGMDRRLAGAVTTALSTRALRLWKSVRRLSADTA
jgi:hypothetical protein